MLKKAGVFSVALITVGLVNTTKNLIMQGTEFIWPINLS